MPNESERNAHPVERQKETTVDAVCGLNALLRAEKRSHRNVGHKNSVSRYHMYAMSYCNELSNQLTAMIYKPDKGEIHEIFEPKYRVTTASKYKDRVPQSSFVTNYFYKKVVPHLSDSNYACLKGRGVDKARERLKEILRQSNHRDWCLKVDMRNYFASIKHNKLYYELFEYITDPWARWFFKVTVENSSNPDGLDLGSEVYQLSAVSFLNKLDHELNINHRYIRYQDDLLYIGSKADCTKALETIKQESVRLGLKIHEKKTFMQPITRPIKFLGFTFLLHDTGRVTQKRLPEKVRRERRKLKRMKYKGVPIERVLTHYTAVRACMKKGSRSDVVKLDRYFNQLFQEEIQHGGNQTY